MKQEIHGYNVNEASEKVGISNASYFAKKFLEFHGYLLSEVKKDKS